MVTRLLILAVLVSAIQCFEGARGEIVLLFQFKYLQFIPQVKNYGPLLHSILPFFSYFILAISREID